MADYSHYQLNNNEIAMFNTCIFCGENIEGNNRFEEHVIPANIYGFIKSHDICRNCGKIFGDNIDQLAIRQPNILEAMEVLGYPKVNQYKQNLPYYSEDKTTGKKISMIWRGNNFVPKNIDDIRDTNTIHWLLQKEDNTDRVKYSSGEILYEIKRVQEALTKSKPGDIISSKGLNKSFITKQSKGIYLDNKDIQPITPLLAKIMAFALNYVIPHNKLTNLKYYDVIIKHAIGKSELAPIKVFESVANRQKIFNKWHGIDVFIDDNSILFSITLFDYLRWIVVLDIIEPIRILDGNSKVIKSIEWRLIFENMAAPFSECRIDH